MRVAASSHMIELECWSTKDIQSYGLKKNINKYEWSFRKSTGKKMTGEQNDFKVHFTE